MTTREQVDYINKEIRICEVMKEKAICPGDYYWVGRIDALKDMRENINNDSQNTIN